jgi:hypothetical protein
MSYTVNVQTTGSYTVSFRVATTDDGASLQLDNGGYTVYAKVAVPNTGGWQTWTTVTATVNLTAGVQTIRVLSLGGAATWNLNWMSYALVASAGVYPIPGTIQAESYSTMLGVATQPTGDAGGGLNVGWITYKDYMSYQVNVQTTGSYTVSFRVATIDDGASLQLDNGGYTVYAKVAVPNTGGWQTWTTVTATVNLTAGVQTIRVLSLGGTATWNMNWMSFTSPGAAASTDVEDRTGESLSAFTDSLATQSNMLLLYPNPTTDAFQLSMNNPQTGKFLVQVISPSGRLVKTYSFEKGLPEMQVQVSLAGLPAGVYVIRIGGTDWQVIKKVMKL